MICFIFPDAILGQELQLGIQRPFILFCDKCDLKQQFRLKTYACLNFVRRHANTPIIF